MKEMLDGMPNLVFEVHKKLFQDKEMKKIKEARFSAENLWDEIEDEFENFDRIDIDVEQIKSLKKTDVSTFFEVHELF